MRSNHFAKECIKIIKNSTVNSKSRLLSLSPYIDERGIIRVGGRLQNTQFNDFKKHPIVLHPNHFLTKLITRHEHVRLFHCGPLNLLASLREKFWPISGRKLAKEIVHKCVTCYRVKPKNIEQLMGSLPKARTTSLYPFFNTGMDYAGPFQIRDKKSRRYKLTKCYIALFICMSTRAMHIELVSDLTAEGFIAALRRFVVRRGRPQALFSDNATNYVGANAQLKELALHTLVVCGKLEYGQ